MTVPRPASKGFPDYYSGAGAMAARLILSPVPHRRREPECSSAEKEPQSKQRSLKEFGVVCQGPPSSAKGSPASSVKDLTASSAQASENRKYGVRGTCGTFAGKHPPNDEDKLKQFLQDRDEHWQMTPTGR